jgi:CRP-like cAMP-binding protein
MDSAILERDHCSRQESPADAARSAHDEAVESARPARPYDVMSPSVVRHANRLLAALPMDEWHRLEPDVKWVDMPVGATLCQAGTVLRHVYFPATAIVSLVSSMKDGSSTEVAVVGAEGVVGVCAFMGGGRAMSGAVVQGAGHGLRMSAEAIAHHSRRSAVLMQQLLCYTQALFTHMAQTAACNRHHALNQRLCRWLLLNLDRHDGNEVKVTQQRIAEMLGVRREGVTGGASDLQKAGLIRYSRGRIVVLDRPGLEQRCCECYSVVRQAYDRLAGHSAEGAWWAPFGRQRLPASRMELPYRSTAMTSPATP